MPRPTSATTIQRPDLGVIAYELLLKAEQKGFMGLKILPILRVPFISGDYPVIPLEALLKDTNTSRAPRSKYPREDWEFETGTYACKENGVELPIDDVERKMYAHLKAMRVDEISVEKATDIILRRQEKRIAAAVFNPSNITQTAAVTTEWSTAASCTPRADVMAAKRAMRLASGLIPNVMAISKTVFDNLFLSAEILNAFKYTNPVEMGGEEAQRRTLAQYFGVGEVLVGNAIKDTAKKGKPVSIADIWDDEYALLAAVSSGGEDIYEPCLGRTYLWIEDSPENIVVETYREDSKRSDIYRVRQNTDEAFVFTGAGYLLSNITA